MPLTGFGRLLLEMDKKPTDSMTEIQKRQALFIYRKIAVLRNVRCCGICGTHRHGTKPFWCLGMRLCRHCIQTNLVSNLVLYERYWVTFSRPVQTHESFVDAVCMNVFFFSTRVTPNQRLDFSCDQTDFPGGMRTVWFFWKPHLEHVLNMKALEREGLEKHAAARTIRAITRRALILRSIRHTSDRKAPTLLSTGRFACKDFRSSEFRIRKAQLLDKTDHYLMHRMSCQIPAPMYARLSAAEDRVTPFMFN